MPSTTTCRCGDVAVNVAFSNHSGSKRRLALVVCIDAFHRDLPDLILCPISSRPRYHRRPGSGDVPLRRWRSVGLRRPSTVRVSKLLAVGRRIIERVLSSVSEDDLASVRSTLLAALGLVGGA
jgi:mRNA-degrading endonuclease toxin of MazEF toxin-antitoxin module